jgi:hypothetical protein
MCAVGVAKGDTRKCGEFVSMVNDRSSQIMSRVSTPASHGLPSTVDQRKTGGGWGDLVHERGLDERK